MPRKRILIVCSGNSARSQIAEGLIRHEAGDAFEVFSAGTHPAPVRSEAVTVMRELSIDISGQHSKPVTEFAGQEFDFVITVCDRAREEDPARPAQAVEVRIESFRSPTHASKGRFLIVAGVEDIRKRFADAPEGKPGWRLVTYVPELHTVSAMAPTLKTSCAPG